MSALALSPVPHQEPQIYAITIISNKTYTVVHRLTEIAVSPRAAREVVRKTLGIVDGLEYTVRVGVQA